VNENILQQPYHHDDNDQHRLTKDFKNQRGSKKQIPYSTCGRGTGGKRNNRCIPWGII